METICEQAKQLPEQKTQAWLDFRKTKITSTDLGVIIDGRPNEINTLVQKKNGYQKHVFEGNEATRHGVKYEDVAMARFSEIMPHLTPILLNMIEHKEDPRFIFSPDGVLPNGDIIEIKSPYSRIINGSISKQYQYQIQLGMAIMYSHGFENTKCYFIEYKPPQWNRKVECDYEKEILSIKIVQRDVDFFATIQKKCQDLWQEVQLHKSLGKINYEGFLPVIV